jgi:hypothetical protein
VERDALPQGQGAGGMTEVVEADVHRETGFLEESPMRAHHGVAPADLAFRVREDQAGVLPAGSLHSHLALLGAVCLEDLDGVGADVILRSLPVLVVETRVFVRVSAERLTVMEGLPVRSTSSHRRAAA